MNKLVTITISVLHFVLSMILIILLPNNVPIELAGSKVATLGSKWVNIIWAILPVIISLTMLIAKNKDSDKQKLLYKRRDIFATILSYLVIVFGWVLMSIANNKVKIGQTITVAIKSLIILALSLLWSVFVYKIKDFDFKDKYKKIILMWLFYYLSSIAFVLAAVGVITKDHLAVLIIDSVFVIVSILILTIVPNWYVKYINKCLQDKPFSQQKFWVKGTAPRVKYYNRTKTPSKIKPAKSNNVNKK